MRFFCSRLIRCPSLLYYPAVVKLQFHACFHFFGSRYHHSLYYIDFFSISKVYSCSPRRIHQSGIGPWLCYSWTTRFSFFFPLRNDFSLRFVYEAALNAWITHSNAPTYTSTYNSLCGPLELPHFVFISSPDLRPILWPILQCVRLYQRINNNVGTQIDFEKKLPEKGIRRFLNATTPLRQ